MKPVTLEQALKELRSADWNDRQNGFTILGEYQDEVVADTMVEVLPTLDIHDEHDGYFAAQLISELANRADTRVINPALEVLRNTDEEVSCDVQEAALEALAQLQAREALPFLSEALLFQKDGRYSERDIVDAIYRIGGSETESLFLKAVSSRRNESKRAALAPLWKIGTQAAIPALQKVARSKNLDLSVEAISLISAIDGTATSFHRAIDACQSNGEKILLIRLCCHRNDSLSKRLLEEKLIDPEWESHRWQILDQLAESGSATALPFLDAQWASEETTPWQRVQAGLRILDVAYRDDVVEYLFAITREPEKYQDLGDSFQLANAIREQLFAQLGERLAAHPLRFIQWIALLDDIRRERIKWYGGIHLHWAGEAVKAVVKSEYYDAYDAWLVQYKSEHALD